MSQQHQRIAAARSPFSVLRRLSAATLCVIALSTLAPALHVGADTLVLRLDEDLGPARSLADFTGAPAVLLGVSDLRGQRAADMERQGARHRAGLETQERLIAGLEGVLSAQDGAIASLQTELARPAATPAPPETPAALVDPPARRCRPPAG